MNTVELISKKQRGEVLSTSELQWILDGFLQGDIPDYQMSAWLMAVFFKGLHIEETATLTSLYKNSGKSLSFSSPYVADKHSTGGVGDKTSLILAPILAVCGVFVPMISGRGLGHTGGTLDKLESIKGFNTQLSLKTLCTQVEKIGLGLVGQTKELCPADKKIYALRDVTGTVSSIPLICASIMSKKLAEGIKVLVLDVKFGSGAFMESYEQAKDLALQLKHIGESQNLKVAVLLTNMNQPLGRFSGNVLEVKECIDILQNKNYVYEGRDLYKETRELSLQLAVHALKTVKNISFEEAFSLCAEALSSGKAYDKFVELCLMQGAECNSEGLVLVSKGAEVVTKDILSTESGFLQAIDVKALGYLNVELGAGRKKVTDVVDPEVGFEMKSFLGQKIKKGDSLLTIYARSQDSISFLENRFLKAFSIGKIPLKTKPLIAEVLPA